MTDKKGSDSSPGVAWHINESDRKEDKKGKSGKTVGHAFQINSEPEEKDDRCKRPSGSRGH